MTYVVGDWVPAQPVHLLQAARVRRDRVLLRCLVRTSRATPQSIFVVAVRVKHCVPIVSVKRVSSFTRSAWSVNQRLVFRAICHMSGAFCLRSTFCTPSALVLNR